MFTFVHPAKYVEPVPNGDWFSVGSLLPTPDGVMVRLFDVRAVFRINWSMPVTPTVNRLAVL